MSQEVLFGSIWRYLRQWSWGKSVTSRNKCPIWHPPPDRLDEVYLRLLLTDTTNWQIFCLLAIAWRTFKCALIFYKAALCHRSVLMAISKVYHFEVHTWTTLYIILHYLASHKHITVLKVLCASTAKYLSKRFISCSNWAKLITRARINRLTIRMCGTNDFFLSKWGLAN